MAADTGTPGFRRRLTTRALLAVLLAAAGAVAVLHRLDGGPAAGADGTTAAGTHVWSDEFDGAVNSAPDSGRWAHNTGGTGWGNDELEYYTDSTDNAALDGAGHLVITARRTDSAGFTCQYGPCRYTSARLLTAERFSQTYGRFETRLKMPRGRGLWPAFWILSDNFATNPGRTGEIDVMENVGSEPGTVYGSLHGPGYSKAFPFVLPGGQEFADDFHVFAVDWTPTAITWSVDGEPYGRQTPADTGDQAWVFDQPFFVIVNLAVGGRWPGPPDAGTTFPQSMTVDYVRVHSYDGRGRASTPAASSARGASPSEAERRPVSRPGPQTAAAAPDHAARLLRVAAPGARRRTRSAFPVLRSATAPFTPAGAALAVMIHEMCSGG